MEFGTAELRTMFRQKDGFVMANHGSYGLVPESVMEKRFQLLREQEEQPDVWFRVTQKKLYPEMVQLAAQFVGAKNENIFIVNNVTYGTNCVLKSLKWNEGDEILLTSHSYKSVITTSEELHRLNGVNIRYVQITLPIQSEDEIIEKYRDIVTKYPKIKLAIIDHITSASALKMPVERLTQVCHNNDVLVHIDGAHAPGQLELDVSKINPDFYVGNFHKWCYTSRHCAFLYVSPRHQGEIRPVVTSNFKDRPLVWQFAYWGTCDNSSYFTLKPALEFHNSLGGTNAINTYTGELLRKVVSMFEAEMGLQLLPVPTSMRAPRMVVIQSPIKPQDLGCGDTDELTAHVWKMYGFQACFVAINNQVWMRLSCNVYNNMQDYQTICTTLIQIKSQLNN